MTKKTFEGIEESKKILEHFKTNGYTAVVRQSEQLKEKETMTFGEWMDSEHTRKWLDPMCIRQNKFPSFEYLSKKYREEISNL